MRFWWGGEAKASEQQQQKQQPKNKNKNESAPIPIHDCDALEAAPGDLDVEKIAAPAGGVEDGHGRGWEAGLEEGR